MEIRIQNEVCFARDLEKYYLKEKFGSFNKTELEELFIYLLMEYGNLKTMSNFQISIALSIPESRVRSIMYRTQLKYYDYYDWNIRKDLLSLFVDKKYEIKKSTNSKKKADNIIAMTIENQYLKEALEAKIKEAGNVIEGDFNKETLKISEKAFAELVAKCFAPEEIEAINKAYKDVKGKDSSKFSLKETLLSFVAKRGLEASVAVLSTVLTGGNISIGVLASTFVNKLLDT
jgi:hypothetical protein